MQLFSDCKIGFYMSLCGKYERVSRSLEELSEGVGNLLINRFLGYGYVEFLVVNGCGWKSCGLRGSLSSLSFTSLIKFKALHKLCKVVDLAVPLAHTDRSGTPISHNDCVHVCRCSRAAFDFLRHT